MPLFDSITTHEMQIIHRIAKRASHMAAEHGPAYPLLDADMDISSVHLKTPLDLAALEIANTNDFSHDVFGIRKHLNRETGELEDGFSPRFMLAGGRPG